MIGPRASPLKGRATALWSVAASLVLLPSVAGAANISWIKMGDGAWFAPKNWANNQVPMFNDNATDDIANTTITQDDGGKSILVKTLALTNSTLKFVSSFRATDGVALDKGTLLVGINDAGGTISRTAITGSGTLSFSKSARNTLDRVTFNGGMVGANEIAINNTAGGTVTVKGGIANSGPFSMSDNSSVVFDGDQTAQETFKLSGTSAFTLVDGTTLTFKDSFVYLVNDDAAVATSLGNISANTIKPNKIVFEGALIEPTKERSDNPVSVTIAANEILVGGIFHTIGSQQSSYMITTAKFTNKKGGKVTIFNDLGGQFAINAAGFNNAGEFFASGPLNIFTEKFVNAGMFTVAASTTDKKTRVVVNPLNGKGSVAANSGTLVVQKGANLTFLNGYVQTGKDAVTTVDGNLDIQNAAGKRGRGRLEGGAVDGAGTVNGNLKVEKGIVKPGDPDPPGILTINGRYEQDAGGSLAIRIDRSLGGPIACDGTGCYSQLDVTHGVTLDGGALDVTLGSALQVGDLFGIVDNLGGAPITGTFAGLPDDGTLTADYGGEAYRLQISYEGDILSPSAVTFGGGNDIVLDVLSETRVPEPAPWALMIIGFGGIGSRLRRQRQASAGVARLK